MSGKNRKPLWPVLIHYANDPELDLITSQEEWNKREDIRLTGLQPEDKIIESNGQVFKLPIDENAAKVPLFSGDQVKLEELLGLIKAHMSESGACCVAKLYAPDYVEAFKIIIDEKKGEA